MSQVMEQVQSAALLTIQRLYQALKSRPAQEKTDDEYQEVTDIKNDLCFTQKQYSSLRLVI